MNPEDEDKTGIDSKPTNDQATERDPISDFVSRSHTKTDLLENNEHWILHELTYPAKDEIQPRTIKDKVWDLFEDPTSSTPALYLSIIIMIMICISGLTFLIETIPNNAFENHTWPYYMEVFFVTCFTIEYLCRFLSCPDKKLFLLSFLNAIDLFAILPFYIEVLFFRGQSGSATPIIRVVRLTRVFRIIKVSKYVGWIRVFTNAIQKSVRPLLMLLYIMTIGMILCSTAIYFVEKEVINPQTKKYPFESIPSSFWWSIITMTTVGYGDAVPQTAIGKFIGGITSLCGILVLALPITVISSNFNNEMEKMKRVQSNPVSSIQALRKLLTERYRYLVEEKKKDFEKQYKFQLNKRKSISLTQNIHSKIKDTLFHKTTLTNKVKVRAHSVNMTTVPIDCSPISDITNKNIPVSALLSSPAAKSKLQQMAYNRCGTTELIEPIYDNINIPKTRSVEPSTSSLDHVENTPKKLLQSAISNTIKFTSNLDNKLEQQIFNLSSNLTNEDIRGILACHIVSSLVTLIEKEEETLRNKINNLISKQFDFLLTDISRVFSEIPHFHGLSAGHFGKQKNAKPNSKKKK